MTRFLPAAAIPEGSVVRVPESDQDIFVDIVVNSTPHPGVITWVDNKAIEFEIGAATQVEIVSIP